MILRRDKSCSPEHVILKSITNVLVLVGGLLNPINIELKILLFWTY